MESIRDLAFTYMGRLVLGALVWFVGKKIVDLLVGFLDRRMAKVEVDASLHSFVVPLVKGLLQVLLVLTVAATVGIEITTFAAIIGAASLAVGLAFQGSLANFAGGVLILLFKPFKVGDFIEAAGYSGTVREIQVFHTVLQTPDSQKVIIPNADLSNSSAVNYSAYENRRATVKLPISFGSDFKLAKEVIQKVADNHPLVLKDPAPVVVMGEFGDDGPVVWARVWAKRTDYWTMLFDFQEQMKDAIAEAGVDIPYRTMDINLKKES